MDIWEYYNRGDWVVIPTNKVFSPTNAAVMGAGLALQAARRFPDLPVRYGLELVKSHHHVAFPDMRLICVPTKNHWRDASSLELVEEAVDWLIGYSDSMQNGVMVAVPPLGCGLGGLRWEDVKPILCRLPARFILTRS